MDTPGAAPSVYHKRHFFGDRRNANPASSPRSGIPRYAGAESGEYGDRSGTSPHPGRTPSRAYGQQAPSAANAASATLSGLPLHSIYDSRPAGVAAPTPTRPHDHYPSQMPTPSAPAAVGELEIATPFQSSRGAFASPLVSRTVERDPAAYHHQQQHQHYEDSLQVGSPAQRDPFCQQGLSLHPSSRLDSRWVTIFGFPRDATTYVIKEFQSYGEIVEQVVSDQGNWMHVKYAYALQAQQALGKTGKVFAGGTLMLGVAPCIDIGVMEGVRDADTVSRSTVRLDDTHMSSPPASSGVPPQSLPRPRATPRALRSAYANANSETEVVPPAIDSAQRSGVVAKTFEYLFGW